MKFKHTFHVFVDNFSVTYKQLLYRLIVSLVAIGLYAAVIVPLVKGLTDSAQYTNLIEGVKLFLKNLVEGNSAEMGEATEQIKTAFNGISEFVTHNAGNIALGALGVILVQLIQKFFDGIGNYVTAAVINDKMALRAQSPFMVTLLHSLKPAALYSLIYVPVSLVYSLAVYVGTFYIIFFLLPSFFFPLKIFLFITLMVVAVSLKMVFTTDWLPALIRGKMRQGQAFRYTFSRKNKRTLNVLSNYLVITLMIFALNVAAVLCTFGAGTLLTVPSSYVILVCFEFVNYYDREELKYFLDKNTVIKPERERALTREEFFRGEDD